MSLNDTVSAERLHIGFFGRRNAGKSSLVNYITNQTVVGAFFCIEEVVLSDNSQSCHHGSIAQRTDTGV